MIEWPYLHVLDAEAIEYVLEQELEWIVENEAEGEYAAAAQALLPYVSVKYALLEEDCDGLGSSTETED